MHENFMQNWISMSIKGFAREKKSHFSEKSQLSIPTEMKDGDFPKWNPAP